MTTNLALSGGSKAIKTPFPHEVWPPNALDDEIQEIAQQRNKDIGIKGRVGPIKELEEQFLEFMENKVKYAVSFNSGTSGLLAAYFALGVEEGVQIIGPALTYHAALSPAFVLKGEVVLCDIDQKTRCIDTTKLESLITEKTKVITVVHQWGHPADMDEVMRIAKKHNLKVLEDCSHAHGSRYKGQLCGTFGDIAVFSLQTNKTLFAGEGGMLVTNDSALKDRATLLGHYRDRSREEVENPDLNKYWVTGFGLKLRMSPFNAIVAKHSMKHFKSRIESKHKCLNYFIDRLSEIDYIEAPKISENVFMGAWYGFKPIYLKEKLNNISRDKLVDALQAEGMEVKPPSGPNLATQPLYSESKGFMFPNTKKYSNKSENTPVALFVQDNALSMPTFWNWDTDKSIIDEYIEAFRKIEDNVDELV